MEDPSPERKMDGESAEELLTNTFGLDAEAEKWFGCELERSKNSYLKEGPQYKHYASTNGKIPTKHLHEALSEFKKRFGGKQNGTKTSAFNNKGVHSPSVLLVASGVSKTWVPDDSIGNAHFLLFPELSAAGGSSALFLTYMPGPEHGAINGAFANAFGAWIYRYPAMENYFLSGQSSGGYGYHQPDKRLFPRKQFRDRQGRDVDKGNKGLPYSRFYWEVEYDNRDPVELRQRGMVYMKCKYTRLFLGAKFYAPEESGEFESAIVLWGKITQGSDKVTVVEAVSFGTKDLSDDHKNEFFTNRHDRLVGVRPDQWRRPLLKGHPQRVPATTPADWMLTVPFQAFLYKVTTEKRDDGTRPYLSDVLEEGEVGDLTINLRSMLSQFAGTIVDDDENEDV